MLRAPTCLPAALLFLALPALAGDEALADPKQDVCRWPAVVGEVKDLGGSFWSNSLPGNPADFQEDRVLGPDRLVHTGNCYKVPCHEVRGSAAARVQMQTVGRTLMGEDGKPCVKTRPLCKSYPLNQCAWSSAMVKLVVDHNNGVVDKCIYTKNSSPELNKKLVCVGSSYKYEIRAGADACVEPNTVGYPVMSGYTMNEKVWKYVVAKGEDYFKKIECVHSPLLPTPQSWLLAMGLTMADCLALPKTARADKCRKGGRIIDYNKNIDICVDGMRELKPECPNNCLSAPCKIVIR